MNDEESARLGREAERALQVLDPVFDKLIEGAVKSLLEAEAPDEVLRLQHYARALKEARNTIGGMVRAGRYVETLAAKH